ncbi:BRCT domain-containing protein [Mucisphaera calidilacus]|uniref:BRCT domain-containing protein n=1 Tax=Mucisphaera calidilacus TaxID=2527982 RepID=A0A518C107_9BACT|nr:hypothetical protein [Mucisphaera calidilacus]QDU72890.1 hypothetical protein Pan265_27660 [Mucisphaera calidilacus]
MRLSVLLVGLLCCVAGCQYTDDVAIEGNAFYLYGEMRPGTRSSIESIIDERGGTITATLTDETAMVIQGEAPPSVEPLDRTEGGDETLTQWAIDSTSAQHYDHLTTRVERMGVTVKSPRTFLHLATREEVNWTKVFTLGIAD